MKKKFDQYLRAYQGMTLVEVAVSGGILAMAMLASVQIRQLSNRMAKTATVNSQITEEHRTIANLVGSIPKIQANSLFKDLEDPGQCSPHPAGKLILNVRTGGMTCPPTGTPPVDTAVWDDLTDTFWSYVGTTDTENPTEVLSVAKFNASVLPKLNTAGCVNCHSGANELYNLTGKWGFGSSMGRKLLAPSIIMSGTLQEQNLSHEINFEARTVNLVTGEANPLPNEQCRALVASNTVRQLNGCQQNCPLNQVVAGSFSCTCVRTCCDASGKNCYCCARTSRFRCWEPQVSQSAATCTSPLVVTGYVAYKSGACGGSSVQTYWKCASSSTTPSDPQITKWLVTYSVITSWVNENDKLPRTMVSRGELQ